MKSTIVFLIAIIAVATASNLRRPLGSKKHMAVLAELD
jgi:hypothetical protein